MIPDYQTLMLPLLKLVADKNEYKLSDLTDSLARQFALTDEDKSEALPSGQAFVFNNRIAWARTYLKKAGLLDSIKRGTIIITERGLKVLAENPLMVNNKLLKQFPEFIDFQTPRKEDGEIAVITVEEEQKIETPEELIESGFLRIQKALEEELLQKLKSIQPFFFERIVVELLVKMGYGGSIQDAGKAIGRSGDEGIDGIIKEDKLGLDVIYVQAKRWDSVVGRPELQKFVGALAGQGAKKGVFITTSNFTKDALEYSPKNETKIVLIDGEKLSKYMIEFKLGVSVQNTYEIKKLDFDYFEED